jgi:hypothetical protein
VLGYAFARRMGLTPATHRRALLAELAATVVVGCGLGLALLAGLAVVITALGAVLGQGRADRDDPMEVLRAGV